MIPRGRPRNFDIANLTIDPAIQARERIDPDVVTDYALAMERGDRFPAVVVFSDGSRLWLADGFHRVAAASRAGRVELPAQITRGTRDDAAWYALGANKSNGLRLSNADKERAVTLALKTRSDASDRDIAAHVGVDHKTVGRIRKVLLSIGEIPDFPARTTSDGREYPSARKPAVTSTCDDPPPAVDDDPPPPPETDRVGNPIPNDQIAEAFQRDHELVEFCTQLSRMKTATLARIEMGDPLFAHMTGSQIEVGYNNIRRAMDACRPFAVCPYCGGEGCKACRSTGWCNELTYKAAPPELKRKT